MKTYRTALDALIGEAHRRRDPLTFLRTAEEKAHAQLTYFLCRQDLYDSNWIAGEVNHLNDIRRAMTIVAPDEERAA